MDGARVLIPESRFDYLDVILSLLAVSVVLAICLRPQLCACGRSSSARRREAALAAALAASEGRGVANMTNEERIVFVNKNLVVETFGALSDPEEITETEGSDPGVEVKLDCLSEGSLDPLDPHCAICLEDMENNDEVGMAPHSRCPHYYHKDCIYAWLLVNEQCPKCRAPFLCDNDEIAKETMQDVETGQR